MPSALICEFGSFLRLCRSWQYRLQQYEVSGFVATSVCDVMWFLYVGESVRVLGGGWVGYFYPFVCNSDSCVFLKLTFFSFVCRIYIKTKTKSGKDNTV